MMDFILFLLSTFQFKLNAMQITNLTVVLRLSNVVFRFCQNRCRMICVRMFLIGLVERNTTIAKKGPVLESCSTRQNRGQIETTPKRAFQRLEMKRWHCMRAYSIKNWKMQKISVKIIDIVELDSCQSLKLETEAIADLNEMNK